MWSGGNAVMRSSSKSCGRLRQLTVAISIAFFERPWSTDLNKNLYLEGNVIFCQPEINYILEVLLRRFVLDVFSEN